MRRISLWDVFVRAFRSFALLQAPEAFTSWLYRIAVNLQP